MEASQRGRVSEVGEGKRGPERAPKEKPPCVQWNAKECPRESRPRARRGAGGTQATCACRVGTSVMSSCMAQGDPVVVVQGLEQDQALEQQPKQRVFPGMP